REEGARARRPRRLRVVLTREEIRSVLERLDGAPRLMALLLYGAGLRLLECARLRVKDVDLATSQIVVRSGKGAKDRVTMLPAAARPGLLRHLESCAGSTRTTCDAAPAGWRCPTRSQRSTPTPAGNGAGSGSFRPRDCTRIGSPASAGASTCTSPCCRVTRSTHSRAPAWRRPR